MNNNFLSTKLPSFIWYFISPHKSYLILFIIAAITSGVTSILGPYIVKILIDGISHIHYINNVYSLFFWPFLLFIINTELHSLSWRGVQYANYVMTPIVRNNIMEYAINYTKKQSHSYFQETFSGSVSHHILTLADNIERIVNNNGPYVIRAVVLLVLAFITLYMTHPVFFAIILLWAVPFMAISIHFSSKINYLSDQCAKSRTEFSGQLVDLMSNISAVRAFSMSAHESGRMTKYFGNMVYAFRTKEKFLLILYTLQGISISITAAIILYFLIKFYVIGMVTAGDFALILGITSNVAENIWWVTEQIDHINDAVGRCKRSIKELFKPITVSDIANASDLVALHGEVSFIDVSFGYRPEAILFNKLNVTIRSGQSLGLVGYSGSGKTTFVNLILRLFDVNSGSILIDGQNIASVTQDSLRRSIAIIPQDSAMFNRTIMENIRYGLFNATDEEVIEAAKIAYAHDFISGLPDGYNTTIGERGVKLSGGQRQRLAIARAILKAAKIIIMDEATSQLDSITERYIQKSIEALMHNRTAIIIAHRLSTLLNVERILVFDNGSIVQDGSHAELIEQGGLYTAMWNAQIEGFLPTKLN